MRHPLADKIAEEMFEWYRTGRHGANPELDNPMWHELSSDDREHWYLRACGLLNFSPDQHLGYMTTYSGVQVEPLNPRAGLIRHEDIAWALGHTCRWGGHVGQYYSVAEHTVLISRFLEDVSWHAAWWGLHHDDTEAYLGDIPRPLKAVLPSYKLIEQMWEDVITGYFRVEERPKQVKEADRAILSREGSILISNWDTGAAFDTFGFPLPVEIECWPPELAARKWMERYDELTNRSPHA